MKTTLNELRKIVKSVLKEWRDEISEGDEEVSTDPKKERNDKLNSELKYLKANSTNYLFPKMIELSSLLSNSNEYIFASNEAQHDYYSKILQILSSIPKALIPIYGNCNSIISLLSNNINESKNKVLKEFNKDVRGRAEDDNIFHSNFLKYVKEFKENEPKIINMFKTIFKPTLAELKEVTPKLKDQLYGLYNLIDLFSNLIGSKLKSL